MIISDLYKTEIYCNKYDVNIDDTDVSVVVRLTDFNGYPVTGKEVKLEVNKGKMTAVTLGSSGSITSNGKRITAKTNNNGEIAVSYTANEFGMCTFTANGNNVQLYVSGYRTVDLSAKSGTCYTFTGYVHYNPILKVANLRLIAHVKVTTANTTVVITEIPDGYRPLTPCVVPTNYSTGSASNTNLGFMNIAAGGLVAVRRSFIPSTVDKDNGYLNVYCNTYYRY